jgi:hypothetical protein
LRQGERIRGRAVENEVNVAVDFENFPNPITQFFRQIIESIRRHMVVIGGLQGRQSFRANARCVVAGKVISLLACLHHAFANRLLRSRQTPAGLEKEFA